MAIETLMPISSCWIVTEGLLGLQNQAIGMIESWKYKPLDETRKAANFVYERYGEKMSGLELEGR